MRQNTLTPRELATKRNCTLDYVYRELWAGKVPGAHKEGKRWLIPDASNNGGEYRKEGHKWNR